MVLGVGVDLLSVQRMRGVLATDEGTFVSKVFTAGERAEADKQPDSALFLATRFAAKEAVFKCFGTGEDVRLDQIEILGSETGQPQVSLSAGAKELAARLGIQGWYLSLSNDRELAIAFAAAQGEAKS